MNLYIVSGPSGSGKTSLVKACSNSMDKIYVSVSCTTRPKRINEQDGLNYNFLKKSAFDKMIKDEKMLEHATVFKHQYGTPIEPVNQKLLDGYDVILEIDWQGAMQVKKIMPIETIFIFSSTLTELQERLLNRNSDNPETINYRMQQAKSEMSHYVEYDYLINNDNFAEALNDLKTIIMANRLKLIPQKNKYQKLIDEILK